MEVDKGNGLVSALGGSTPLLLPAIKQIFWVGICFSLCVLYFYTISDDDRGASMGVDRSVPVAYRIEVFVYTKRGSVIARVP